MAIVFLHQTFFCGSAEQQQQKMGLGIAMKHPSRLFVPSGGGQLSLSPLS
jgi:hypothetical protein